MKKSQFAAKIKGSGRSKSAQSHRYRHLSASARGGYESSNSLREIREEDKGARAESRRRGPHSNRERVWYAIADPHQPTWGVYTDYDEVAKIEPHRFKQFTDEHEARQWLEDVDNGVIDPVGAGFPIECVPRGSLAARSLTASSRHSSKNSLRELREGDTGKRTTRRRGSSRGGRDSTRGRSHLTDGDVNDALLKYNASPASKFGRAKLQKGKQHWYAVVIGRTIGVFHGYHLAWQQVNAFTKGLSYTYESYNEALEEFMRWDSKQRIHFPDSTMYDRGEDAQPFAEVFFGANERDMVREDALARRAQVRQSSAGARPTRTKTGELQWEEFPTSETSAFAVTRGSRTLVYHTMQAAKAVVRRWGGKITPFNNTADALAFVGEYRRRVSKSAKEKSVASGHKSTHHGTLGRAGNVHASSTPTTPGAGEAHGRLRTLGKEGGVSNRHKGLIGGDQDELFTSIEDALSELRASATSRGGSDATTADGSPGGINDAIGANQQSSPKWLSSLLGAGSGDDKVGGGREQCNNGEAHEVPNPKDSPEKAGAVAVSNSGAASVSAVKYDGVDPNGGEPQKTTVDSAARGPADTAMLGTVGTSKVGALGTTSTHVEIPVAKSVSASTSIGGALRESTSSESSGAYVVGGADTNNLPVSDADSSFSDGTDVAGGRSQVDDTQADGIQVESPKGTAGSLNTLFSYGFKQVDGAERRLQHEKALAALGPYLKVNEKEVIDLTCDAAVETGSQAIPKKKKKPVQHASAAPVPMMVTTKIARPKAMKLNSVKREPGNTRKANKRGSGKSSNAVKREPGQSRDAANDNKSEGDGELKRHIKKRNEQLARAVLKAQSETEAERAMLQRVYASQPQSRQSYRKRLRSAVYFEDSGSEGEAGAAIPEEDSPTRMLY